jgi:hypothetical protein
MRWNFYKANGGDGSNRLAEKESSYVSIWQDYIFPNRDPYRFMNQTGLAQQGAEQELSYPWEVLG